MNKIKKNLPIIAVIAIAIISWMVVPSYIDEDSAGWIAPIIAAIFIIAVMILVYRVIARFLSEYE